MTVSLDGPRIAPASGQTKQLVVFLHGYGADGNDLIEIGHQWRRILPDTAFVSPHAPEPCGMAPMGRQWFELTFRDPTECWRGVNKAVPVLNAFLDAELAKHGLDDSCLALVGFSQGTMMALHAGLRREKSLAAIVGHSGMLVLEDDSKPEGLKKDIRSRPSVFLTHGEEDEVIPAGALFLAIEALNAADVPCQWHMARHLGHGIDGECMRQAGQFLASAFGLPVQG